MLKCLNCNRELVAEYDSQICAYCAGDLPCTDWHRLFSVRRFLVRLKNLVGRDFARAGVTRS
jgi:hypothetical protein